MTGRFWSRDLDEYVHRLFYTHTQTKSSGTTRPLQVLTRGAAEGVTDWHKKYSGAVAKQAPGSVFWFKHTQKREFSLLISLGCKVPPRQIHSDLSLLRNIPSYQKTTECNRAHLAQHRLNQQPPGTSSLWNTGRILGKATHLSLPYPATSYYHKNPLSGANQ